MDSTYDSYLTSPAGGAPSASPRGGTDANKFVKRPYGVMFGARRSHFGTSLEPSDSKIGPSRDKIASGLHRSQLQASVDVYDEDSEYILEDNDVFVDDTHDQMYSGSKTALQLDYPEIYSATTPGATSADEPSLTEESNRYLSIKSGVYLEPGKSERNSGSSNLVHQKSSESHDSTASYSSFVSQSSSQGANSNSDSAATRTQQPKLQRTSSYEVGFDCVCVT
ncbi:hypothetical protein Ciccas_011160 [Cichlidogyrus casuarinus]|uniref:Uncharacterized protein n=1 Tax=Cichlidogyrus casuarinus TaxID=1844966 RepID=A0ABD2PS20_9PLAT